MTYRFPTIPDGHDVGRQIPVLPEGDIFDTIPGAEEVEAIMARPSWSFEEADTRLRPQVEAALGWHLDDKDRDFDYFASIAPAKPEVVKAKRDRTKSNPTPRRPRKGTP